MKWERQKGQTSLCGQGELQHYLVAIFVWSQHNSMLYKPNVSNSKHFLRSLCFSWILKNVGRSPDEELFLNKLSYCLPKALLKLLCKTCRKSMSGATNIKLKWGEHRWDLQKTVQMSVGVLVLSNKRHTVLYGVLWLKSSTKCLK